MYHRERQSCEHMNGLTVGVNASAIERETRSQAAEGRR
ncbi:uncharacterized protein HVO_A0327 (plasmid) [Haloferax volcanii DS2]|uniref:Uncharacterized protein n=1 Tax=Haloferax volcanii (strain ATCC 29605 / DSM 3757 / JCM 8879 / NBRC 14742 / NCIMB 2012 / VKM B-1768 / DS2) TaxID=309800 RepID=D4GR04_HALVD|nr:uncharacterized protein HVO_A0327 [Haloferax volcanii DS2]